MAQKSDWLPSGRQDQITMAVNWLSILQNGTAAANWGVPAGAVNELGLLESDAEIALKIAKNEKTRTPVANQQCQSAFTALIAAMRDMKKRWFYVPPLAEADLVALGLKVPDTTPTYSGVPTAQVSVETYLVGRHQLGLKIVYVTGSPDDPANKAYRVWYSVVAQGEAPPASPGELRESFSTKRKRDVIDFDYGDSGKTAYFAVQAENGKLKGPWGPLVSALIP